MHKINGWINKGAAFLALAFMACLGIGGAMFNISRIWWKNDIMDALYEAGADPSLVTGNIHGGFGVFYCAVLAALVIATVVIYFTKRKLFTGFLFIDLGLALMICHNMFFVEYWFEDTNPEVNKSDIDYLYFFRGYTHWIYLITFLVAYSWGITLAIKNPQDEMLHNWKGSLSLLGLTLLAVVPFVLHTIWQDEYIFTSSVHKPLNYLLLGTLSSFFVFGLTSFFYDVADSCSDDYLDYYYTIKQHRREVKRYNLNSSNKSKNSDSKENKTIDKGGMQVKLTYSPGSYRDAIKKLREVMPAIQEQARRNEEKNKKEQKANYIDFSDFDI